MFINLSKTERAKLNKEQQEFLLKIVPIGKYIQEQTFGKAQIKGYYAAGMLTSVASAEIIYQSKWGQHPISQHRFKEEKGKTSKYANNLALLESNQFWKGSTVLHESKEYRGYKNWMEFAVNYTDYLVFSGDFKSFLQCPTVQGQVAILSLTKNNPKEYNGEILNLIKLLELTEFDGQKETVRSF